VVVVRLKPDTAQRD